MMPTVSPFGQAANSSEVQLYTLTNKQGAQAAITNYAGTLVRLLMPDRAGNMGDVVLGFDDVSGYQSLDFAKPGPTSGR